MSDGYIGRFVRINLTNSEVKAEQLNEELKRNYIGGAGIGARILYDEVPPKADPLGPENKLIVFSGPFQGAFLPSSGRFHIIAKSPATGIMGDANAGGHFGAYLKYSGYDGIVVEGASKEPVYVLIDNGTAEIRDAAHLWGKNVYETETAIKEDVGDEEIKICSIGLAGENLVKFAGVMNDLDRTAARTGLGAVMGSKKLKAIAVRGDFSVKVADPGKLEQLTLDLISRAKKNEDLMWEKQYGTIGSLGGCNDSGNLPTHNWLRNRFDEGAKNLDGFSNPPKTVELGGKACFGCPEGCGRYSYFTSGPYKDNFSGGPEYETGSTLGSLLLIDDFEAMAYLNALCNLYGMDTISAGGVLAFAMECYEKGIITKEQTGGIDLTWGNGKAAAALLEKIAKREDIGEIFAEGVKRAAEIIGSGSEEFAIHVKGLELPAHEPRAAPGLGLGYATSTRGACHLRTYIHAFEIWGATVGLPISEKADRFATEGKAAILIQFQNFMSLMNSFSYCSFIAGYFDYTDWVNLLNATTGWNVKYEDLMKTGERIWNLQKAYNIREGGSRKDDTLPGRFYKVPLPHDPGKGRIMVDLDPMLDEYYGLRGWDKEGIPTKEKLLELGLSNIEKDLHS